MPVFVDPAKLAIHPEAQVIDSSNCLVVLPNPGEINIADLILSIKVDQYVAITNWKISRHKVLIRKLLVSTLGVPKMVCHASVRIKPFGKVK